MPLSSLTDSELKPLVQKALEEDLGTAGDVTTDAIVSKKHTCRAAMIARKEGVVAGLDLARLAFSFATPMYVSTKSGWRFGPAERHTATVQVPRDILKAERTALNFLCHLSGVATETHKLVEAAKPHKARISCTRKTTPGLRLIEKYAVRAGGGVNHRFGLHDMVLIRTIT